VLCLAVGAAEGAFALEKAPPASVYWGIAYAAVCCTIGGYMLQNKALPHISAKTVGMVQCLYPVMTAFVSFLVLDERLNALGLMGAALILGCILFISASKEDKTQDTGERPEAEEQPVGK